MMNKRFLYLLLSIGFLLAGCESKPVQTTNERTIIVYINADNNLYDMVIGSERYGALMDVNEMELGWQDDAFRNATLLVYLNSGDKDVPKIYRIRHNDQMPTKDKEGAFDNGIRSAVVQTYEKHDSSKPEILSRVLNDAMQIAPATSYGLVLWSHGTGWVPMGMGQPLKSSGATTYTFGASDTYNKNQMEIPDLAKALPSGVVFDYIAFDACYMGCIEVAYELRNHCRYYIGSAVETPIDGFEYHKIMGELVTGDTQGIVQKNYNHYSQQSGWWATCTMSSIDCSKLETLAAATKQLITKNPKALSELTTTGVQDLSSSSSFYNTYIDLGDFIAKNWAYAPELNQWITALEASVAAKYTLPTNLGRDWPTGYKISNYSGYSCYVPRASQPKALAAYRTRFAWSTASGMAAIE